MENKYSVGDRVMFCAHKQLGFTAKYGWLGTVTKLYGSNALSIKWDKSDNPYLLYLCEEVTPVFTKTYTEEDVL